MFYRPIFITPPKKAYLGFQIHLIVEPNHLTSTGICVTKDIFQMYNMSPKYLDFGGISFLIIP